MALFPITPPAGIVKNGTDYANKGRWIDGNLIRFENGYLKPIGGWTKLKQTALDGAPIGMYAYNDNLGQPILAVGTRGLPDLARLVAPRLLTAVSFRDEFVNKVIEAITGFDVSAAKLRVAGRSKLPQRLVSQKTKCKFFWIAFGHGLRDKGFDDAFAHSPSTLLSSVVSFASAASLAALRSRYRA